jgi:hypothetical protein
MMPVAHHKLLEREGACLNASPENCCTSGVFFAPPPRPSPSKVLTLRLFSVSARLDSTASGRGSLTQKPSASQHARPARRPVSSCRRRAGLLADCNLAFALLSRAARTHPPHTVGAPLRLRPPRRKVHSPHIEMAFQAPERSSRETSMTGLRPVGRLLLERLPTGLRPVACSSNTSNVSGRSVALATDRHRPSCLDKFALQLRIVGAPTICDVRPSPTTPTTRIAHAERPPPSSAGHALFSGFLARASRRPWLLRTNKNSLSLRIVGLPQPSTLPAGLGCLQRGWLTRTTRTGLHARPARRPVSCCRHRAGLLPTRTARSLQPLPHSAPAFRAGHARRPARPSDHRTTERHAWGNNARGLQAASIWGTPSSPPSLSLPGTVDESLRNPPTSRCTRPRFARRVNGRSLGGCLCW